MARTKKTEKTSQEWDSDVADAEAAKFAKILKPTMNARQVATIWRTFSAKAGHKRLARVLLALAPKESK